jgi:putative protease
MMIRLELLAPAGSKASFEAALKAGADAIYLGGDAFGARHSAANFDDTSLAAAIREAHLLGVRVYLTVNTLVYDREWQQLSAFLDRMAPLGLDAWIVQDLGVLAFVGERYPQIELHASTQMAAQNIEDVETLSKLGVHRVVLPREMRLEEVREIASRTKTELELFVHGALCVSVSGQCYMSSMIGGRSGNRGQCAQSCRQAYDLIDLETGDSVGEKTGMYRLSPKDLNTLERIGEVIDAGVTSLKIEGRMKGPEYVYQTVRAYREAIDRHIAKTSAEKTGPAIKETAFEKIFNRGFTQGWLLGERGGQFLSDEIPGNQGVAVAKVTAFDARAEEVEIELMENLSVGDELQIRKGRSGSGCRVEYILARGQRVKEAAQGTRVRINYKTPCQKGDILRRTYDKREMDRLQAEIHEMQRRIPVTVSARLRTGMPLEVRITDAQGLSGIAVSEVPAEAALKRPLDRERLQEQLGKLGTTAYEAISFELDMDNEATLPIKLINETRRLAAEALDNLRSRTSGVVAAVTAQPDSVLIGQPMDQIDTPVEEILRAGMDGEEPGGAELLESESEVPVRRAFNLKLCVSVPDLGRLHLVLEAGAGEVYFRGPLKDFEQARVLADRYGAKIAWQWTRPNMTRALDHHAQLLRTLKPEAIVVSSPGMIVWARQFTDRVIADFGLNILNCGAEKVVRDLGAEVVTLSPELTGEDIAMIGKTSVGELEILGYGHLPVMVTPHCPIRTSLGGPVKGCAICSGKSYGLRDKTGAIFPVVKTGPCWTEILNSRVLELSDQFEKLCDAGVARYRLHFTIETPDEIMDLTTAHLERLEGKRPPVRTQPQKTHGHFFRGAD